MKNFKEELANIRAFVFDVDGVLTDCTITFDANGEPLRSYNVRDGIAIIRAVKKGYPLAIISGGRGKQLEGRMKMLGVEHIYLDKSNKVSSLEDFSGKSGIPLDQIIYIGDDYPDIAPMKMVRLGVAPADGADDVRAAADYVSKFDGGKGCVRDIIEQVLRLNDDWFECK